MTDFTQSTNVKSAVRKLAEPIADISAFNAMIQSVILNNPFGCVSYMSSGASHPPVEKTREAYTAKIVYQDEDAKIVGRARTPTTRLQGSTPASPQSSPTPQTPRPTAAPRPTTRTATNTPRPSSATTPTGRCTSWTSPASRSPSRPTRTTASAAGSRHGRTPSQHSTDGERPWTTNLSSSAHSSAQDWSPT